MTRRTGDTVLALQDLCVSYGKVPAVTGVSLSVGRGEIVSLIGPNGAGKSTLLGAVMGVLRSQGHVVFDGRELKHVAVEDRVSRGMVLVPEKRALFASMSVEDNLRLGGWRHYVRGQSDYRTDVEAVFGRFPRLRERRSQLAGTLSGGERAMLVLGRALMSKPTLLMLDEPSLGLAPLLVNTIFEIIADLRATGVSMLLVEQNARAALRVSDYAYVLENGAIAHEGSSGQLADDPRLVASYLGGAVPRAAGAKPSAITP